MNERPTLLPINPVIGALAGLTIAAATRRSVGRWVLAGVLVGLAVTLYNTWTTANWVAQVTSAGGIVRTGE